MCAGDGDECGVRYSGEAYEFVQTLPCSSPSPRPLLQMKGLGTRLNTQYMYLALT